MYVHNDPMRRTAEEAAETKRSLVKEGVAYFGSCPYGDGSLESVARELGVTRGAIYHHFGSKRGYFEAVVEQVFSDLRDRVVAASARAGDRWDGLRAGCDVFLAAASDAAFRRIALLDGPAVLGWESWKSIDDRTTAQSLREGLAAIAEQGDLATSDTEAAAVALSGAMNELSLWTAAQPRPRRAEARMRAVVHHMLAALRSP
jgi:AcrR family transcriptional regulator